MDARLKSALICIVLVAVELALTSPDTLAQTGISEVTFHDDSLDMERRTVLREGVSELWAMVAPYAGSYGLDSFPRSEFWAFPDHAGVDRNCDHVEVSGCAYPTGQVYVAVITPKSIPVVAHEAMHLVQTAINPSRQGSSCIIEGAAEWYGDRAVASHPHHVPFELVLDSTQSGIALEEYVPALSGLTTRDQFYGTRYTLAYPTCFLAFHLLMLVEGGEKQGSRAYFRYLDELNRTDWRTAFDRAFKDDFNTFQMRFDLYLESVYASYRFQWEIENERVIRELLACEPTTGAICLT